MKNADFKPLIELLKHRLAVISDADFRTRDPQAHMTALRKVSEDIESEHQRLKAHLPPRLRHFMEQASYQKALDYLEGGDA